MRRRWLKAAFGDPVTVPLVAATGFILFAAQPVVGSTLTINGTVFIRRQRQLHRLRHVVAELGKLLPEDTLKSNAVRELLGYGCLTRMHVVRLLAPTLPGEDHLKDIDFSRDGIRQRREAGYQHTKETLEKAPWRAPHDPMEGFLLHEACGGEMIETPAAK